MEKTGRKPMTMEQVFWSHVNKSEGCWLWTASVNTKGYGHIEFSIPKHRIMRAHRASWTIHFGEIPAGLQVLHKCDIPACVRPDHLFLGTNADNVRDKMGKGRHVKGITHYAVKLTEQDVRDIRAEHQYGKAGKTRPHSMRSIARRYGVTFSAIQAIISGKTWKHLH